MDLIWCTIIRLCPSSPYAGEPLTATGPVHRFFVAILPERRPQWGKRMGELVKKGGFLVTLVFPIDPHVETGPPFFVRPEHYVDVLEPQSQWEKVYDKVPENSADHHVGRERMVVWKKL